MIADAAALESARATGAEVLLVETSRRIDAADRYLPLGGLDNPGLFVPLGRRGPVAYALRRLARPTVQWKRLRNRALESLLAADRLPPVRPLVCVAARPHAPPFLIAAARELGVPEDVDWLLAPGVGDPLARSVFLIFGAGAAVPSWALKFARFPGYTEAFDRDEKGLADARAAAPVVAAHAPTPLGRLEAGGFHASVESAAVGERLIAFLRAPEPASERLAAIERIAAWVVDVARATAAAPQALEAERRRLAEEVLPAYAGLGAPADLVSALPSMPAVLQHADLGSWNLVVDGPRFVVLDWEGARPHGFPLWDLWYLLAHALAQLDGASTLPEQDEHFVRLFAGELPASRVVAHWTRAAAETSGVPADALGPLATLCWLHHGRSHVARGEALRRHAGVGGRPVYLSQRAAELWLSHPALGTGWRLRDG